MIFGWISSSFGAEDPQCGVGLRRHAQIWSVMGLCQDFFRKEAWREVGFTSLEDFLHRFWEAYFAPMGPNNLIWMGWKWRHGGYECEGSMLGGMYPDLAVML